MWPFSKPSLHRSEHIRDLDIVPVLKDLEIHPCLEASEIRSLALLAIRVARLRRDRDPRAESMEAKAGVLMKACSTCAGPWDMTDEAFGNSDTARVVIGYAMPTWRQWIEKKPSWEGV